MAKKSKKNESIPNYADGLRHLREQGLRRLYFLWGAEDYLREDFLSKLKAKCLPEGEDSFSFRRMNGPELDPKQLREAVDAMPFLTERTFVELRDVDLNKLAEADKIQEILTDIPECCTVAFVQSTGFEPDGRLKLIKAIRELAMEICFTAQPQESLIKWISRRFDALGKRIDLDAARHLIFVSGDLMSGLIPEIEKVAAYAKGDKVTLTDIDTVAHHIPEADVFQMTDYIAQKKTGAALSVLSELLGDKNNEPIVLLAMLGTQMRRLYAARLALDRDLGSRYVAECCSIKYDFILNQLMRSARGYTTAQTKHAVELCADADYQIKSSGRSDREILVETLLRIAAGETHA